MALPVLHADAWSFAAPECPVSQSSADSRSTRDYVAEQQWARHPTTETSAEGLHASRQGNIRPVLAKLLSATNIVMTRQVMCAPVATPCVLGASYRNDKMPRFDCYPAIFLDFQALASPVPHRGFSLIALHHCACCLSSAGNVHSVLRRVRRTVGHCYSLLKQFGWHASVPAALWPSCCVHKASGHHGERLAHVSAVRPAPCQESPPAHRIQMYRLYGTHLPAGSTTLHSGQTWPGGC
jgi:hypothetical protein